MSEEKIFIEGLIVKKPHDKAPDFVKASISIKCGELVEFMKSHQNNGWINADIKESKGGKFYAELNTWKPQTEEAPKQPQPEAVHTAEQDLPF